MVAGGMCDCFDVRLLCHWVLTELASMPASMRFTMSEEVHVSVVCLKLMDCVDGQNVAVTMHVLRGRHSLINCSFHLHDDGPLSPRNGMGNHCDGFWLSRIILEF
jgi:hypothetical protein